MLYSKEVYICDYNTRSRKKLVNTPPRAARAELKFATSLPDAGMADCMVRRVGKTGSNRR